MLCDTGVTKFFVSHMDGAQHRDYSAHKKHISTLLEKGHPKMKV